LLCDCHHKKSVSIALNRKVASPQSLSERKLKGTLLAFRRERLYVGNKRHLAQTPGKVEFILSPTSWLKLETGRSQLFFPNLFERYVVGANSAVQLGRRDALD